MSSTESTASAAGDKWVLGITLGLLGSVAINTGNNIQALGLKKLKEDDKKKSQRGIACPPSKKGRMSGIALSFLSIVTSNKIIPQEGNDADNDVTKNQNDDENDDHDNNDTIIKTEISPGDNDDNKYPSPSPPHPPPPPPPPAQTTIQPYESRIWLFGTFVFVTGSLLNFVSYAFAAQSTLASLESIQFVTNIILGKFMQGADVTRTMVIGTLLTVAGTVCAVQFSSKETLELNTAEIKGLYSNPAYIAYLIIMGCAITCCSVVYKYYEKRKGRRDELPHTTIVMMGSYSVWSAFFGTVSVVQAKVIAELLAVQSEGEEEIFRSWFTYFTIALWSCTVVVWLTRLNDALSKFDALFILPSMQCSFIFFAIVSGGIFFREFDGFSPGQWVGFWCGLVVMFGGLVLLTPPVKSDRKKFMEEMIGILVNTKGGKDVLMQRGKEGTRVGGEPQNLNAGRGESNSNVREDPFEPQDVVFTRTAAEIAAFTRTGEISAVDEIVTRTGEISYEKQKEEERKDTTTTTTPWDERNDIEQVAPEKVRERLRDSLTRPSSSTKRNHGSTFACKPKRSPRLSNGALVESIVETARNLALNGSQFLVTSRNGATAYTDAMISARQEKQEEEIRRQKVFELCRVVAIGGDMTHSIAKLIDDLREEYDDLNHREIQDALMSTCSYANVTAADDDGAAVAPTRDNSSINIV